MTPGPAHPQSRLARALWIEMHICHPAGLQSVSRLARALWIEIDIPLYGYIPYTVEARESLVD